MDINQEIQNAYEIIQKGGIILYPTDTVWGIGCDATNAEAVAKIYKLKKRAETQSMIVLMNGEKMIYNVFKEIPEVAWQIIDLSENPTTLVLDKPRNVAPNLIAPDQTLGIRIVKELFCFKLMEKIFMNNSLKNILKNNGVEKQLTCLLLSSKESLLDSHLTIITLMTNTKEFLLEVIIKL